MTKIRTGVSSIFLQNIIFHFQLVTTCKRNLTKFHVVSGYYMWPCYKETNGHKLFIPENMSYRGVTG